VTCQYLRAPDNLEKTATDTISLNTIPEAAIAGAQNGKINDQDCLSYRTTFEARIPDELSPSFETLNLVRNYCLKVDVEAELCGKNFEHKFEIPGVVILSDLTPDSVESNQRVIEGWEHVSDPPPACEEIEHEVEDSKGMK
jgi:hypothetical protein